MTQYRIQDRHRGIIGPISETTVLELVGSGVIGADALVSCDGGPFLSLRGVPQLASALASVERPVATAGGTIGPRTMMGFLYDAHRQRATGLLVLAREPARKDAYLRDGRIVFLSSNIAAERLGRYLVQRGTIAAEELDIALASMHTDSGRLGDTLVRLGLINASELAAHLREHQLERVIELCCWREGRFAFYAGQAFAGADLDLPFTLPELIVRSAREMPAEMIASYLGDDLARVPSWVAAKVPDDLPLTEAELQATALIDHLRSVADVADTMAASREDGRHAALVALHVLAAIGVISFA